MTQLIPTPVKTARAQVQSRADQGKRLGYTNGGVVRSCVTYDNISACT